MVRIVFSGAVTAWRFENGREGDQITDAQHLSKFDGVAYRRESMCDYLADGDDTIALANIGLAGGHIALHFDRASDALIAITEYTAPRRLNAEEMASLKAYTLGQWSDGMGSNFSQDLTEAKHIFIDMYVEHDAAKTEQSDT